MLFIFGTGRYGRVDEHLGSYVDTTFFHVGFVPLVPLRSEMHVGAQTLAVPLRAASIARGLVFAWPPVFVVGLGFALRRVSFMQRPSIIGIGVPLFLTILWGLALYGLDAFAVGRLTARDRARRDLYARLVGVAFDPRLLASSRQADVRRRMETVIDGYAEVASPEGYRDHAERDVVRKIAALAPSADDAFLEAALVLLRLAPDDPPALAAARIVDERLFPKEPAPEITLGRLWRTLFDRDRWYPGSVVVLVAAIVAMLDLPYGVPNASHPLCLRDLDYVAMFLAPAALVVTTVHFRGEKSSDFTGFAIGMALFGGFFFALIAGLFLG